MRANIMERSSHYPEAQNGVYVLMMALGREMDIRIGRIGDRHFRRGIYFYVGSAARNLESRVSRHLRGAKTQHWHIDYFLRYGKPVAVLCIFTSRTGAECRVAEVLREKFQSIPGFGSSDCKCESHLFYQDAE